MLCGSAFKNKGVQRMLDAVIDFMPSPVDIPPVPGTDEDDKPVERRADDNEKFSALAFKLMTDPYVGQLTFVRVYSGVLKSGDSVYNPIRGKKERIGRILQMHANQREEIKEILAGDIAACVGLKDVTTGETLCDPASIITLEKMVFPEPVISQAVEPKTKADQEKMGIALAAWPRKTRRSASRPTRKRPDHHLRHGRAAPRDHRRPHEARVRRRGQRRQAAGRVPRDDPQGRSDVEGKFVRQSGGKGQYGHVVFKIEPQEPGKGFEFVDAIKGGVVPREFIPAVKKGVEDSLPNGVLAGYPVVDVKVTLHLRLVPRGRLERERVQDGRLVRLQGRLPQGLAGDPRADDGGRSRDAGRLRRQRDGRPVVAARHGAGHGRHVRRRQDHQGRGAALGDVRLLDDAALDVAGPRDVHDGVQALQRGAEERRRRDHHARGK
jgi:elongation factor G